jgi:hypothetical protein
MLKLVGSMSLTLKGVLLWTMRGFLGYGKVVGMSHQKYIVVTLVLGSQSRQRFTKVRIESEV